MLWENKRSTIVQESFSLLAKHTDLADMEHHMKTAFYCTVVCKY